MTKFLYGSTDLTVDQIITLVRLIELEYGEMCFFDIIPIKCSNYNDFKEIVKTINPEAYNWGMVNEEYCLELIRNGSTWKYPPNIEEFQEEIVSYFEHLCETTEEDNGKLWREALRPICTYIKFHEWGQFVNELNDKWQDDPSIYENVCEDFENYLKTGEY